jgi:hypothetical protein
MLFKSFIIKALIIFLYILPGWKIIDLMWEAPIHLQGVLLKGRVQYNNDSVRQFIMVIHLKGGVKYLSASENEIFQDTLATSAIKVLFAANTKDEFVKGIEKLGINKEIVDLERVYGIVCYRIGDEQTIQLFVDKNSFLPVRIKNKNFEMTFQKYTTFEAGFFPAIIEINSETRGNNIIYIDEISLLKSSK